MHSDIAFRSNQGRLRALHKPSGAASGQAAEADPRRGFQSLRPDAEMKGSAFWSIEKPTAGGLRT